MSQENERQSTGKVLTLPTGIPSPNQQFSATRNDLQLGRRAIHLLSGVAAAYVYAFYVTHTQATYILGIAVSVLYLFEQVRVKYPELARYLSWFNSLMLRTEERLKESAAVPYAVAVMLMILSFPKPVALVAILTVAISDPISAVVGIRMGHRKWVGKKTVEGSAAFFTSTLIICLAVLGGFTGSYKILFAAPLIAAIVTGLELVPMRIDDNFMIPLYTAFTTLLILWIVGLPI